jgi:hypothetical protein
MENFVFQYENFTFAAINQKITTMDTLVALHDKVEILPPNLRREALLFIEFLIEKSIGNHPKTQRIFGSAKGKIQMSEDFDEPLTEVFEDYM